MRKLGKASLMAITTATMAGAAFASPPPPPNGMIAYQQPTSCQSEPARDSEIVALSTSGQAGPIVPFAVDPTAISHLIPVSGSSGKAVTLVLTSSSSVVWDLRGVAGGRIKAVYVSGQGVQGIIGAPKDAKVEIVDSRRNSSFSSSSGSCRGIPQVSSINDTIPLATSLLSRFGRYPDRLYAGRGASAFDLDKAEAEVPKTADVKIGDIRTNEPLSPDTPPPGPLALKRLLDEGSVRFLSPDVLAQIRSSGVVVEPLGSTSVDPESLQEQALLNRPGIPEETRRRIQETFRQRAEARAQRIAQMAAYVSSYGLLLTRSVESIPQMSGGEYTSTIFVPSDVNVPKAPGARLFRIPMKASEIPQSTRTGSDNPLTRMFDQQPGTVPDVVATWKGDFMTVRMPQADENGVRRPPASTSADNPGQESSSILIPVVVGLLALALIAGAYLLYRRRAVTSGDPAPAPVSGAGSKANRVEALEVMVQDPDLKTAVRRFKEAAMRLIARQDLEEDLTARSNEILQKQFSTQASRYLAARPSADEATGAELDRRMLASLNGMTEKLEEIGAVQNKRHIDALG